MSDIVDRLRRWTHAVDAAPASDLMDEAAAEIERLRLELFMKPVPNILVMADAMLRERERTNHDAAPVPGHEWKSAYENMQRASLRLYAKIRDIADDVCGIGSGVTVSTHHAPEWLDAIACEYHRVRIELEQLRAKTNHDAAPAATARTDADRGRNDKADVRPGEGTGDTSAGSPSWSSS